MATTPLKSVEDYLAAQPEPARTALRRVRAVIRKAVPGSEEVISYRIPAFRQGGRPFIWFAGWKQHYSLYPVNGKVAKAFKLELEPYQLSKGTLRLPLSRPVPVELIGRIAKFRAQEARAANPPVEAPAPRSGATWKFTGRLFRPEGPGLITVLPIPSDVIRAGGLKARQRLQARIDGVRLTSALTSSGKGWYALVIGMEMLKKLGRQPGDAVSVELQVASGPVRIALPPALRAVLKSSPRAKAAFDKLAPSHRKRYAQWISSAKQAETRDRRAKSAVQMLLKGKALR